MTLYIDKSAVVAEIERRKEKNQKTCTAEGSGAYYEDGFIIDIIQSMNTLEVKEENIDEAARKWEDKVYLEKGWQDTYGTPHVPFSEIGNAFFAGVRFVLEVQKGE